MIQNNSIFNFKADNFTKVDNQANFTKVENAKEANKFEKMLSKEVDKNTNFEDKKVTVKEVKEKLIEELEAMKNEGDTKENLETLSLILSLLNKLSLDNDDTQVKVKLEDIKIEVDNLLDGEIATMIDMDPEVMTSKIEKLFAKIGLEVEKNTENQNETVKLEEVIKFDDSEETKEVKEAVKPIVEKTIDSEKPELVENIVAQKEPELKEQVKVAEKESLKAEKADLKSENIVEEVEVETETESDDTTNNSSKFANVDTKVSFDKEFKLEPEIKSNFTTEVQIPEKDVIKQVVSKMEFKLSEGKNEVTVQLKPEILGNLKMDIEVEKGTITAKILVDNYRTKEILENNIGILQNKIEENGMEIKTVEVSVGNNADFEKENQERQFENFNRHTKKLKSKKDKMVISQNYEASISVNDRYENQTIEEGMNLFV